jgi:hypothetical protein
VLELVGGLTRGQGDDAAVLGEALSTALDTPLGPLADGVPFGQVSRRDLLPELDFELPLAGGDSPARRPRRSAGSSTSGAPTSPTGLLSAYPDRLRELAGAPLRGYLSGSVDAVVRVGPHGSERYLVVDHKTNRLAPREEQLTAWHYRHEALERSMIDAHYPLQALLYAVALHRYLRWRRPGYEPAEHLGGVLYLYLRGMSGPGVVAADGHVPGVFSWRPPARLVTDFSDLLAGGHERPLPRAGASCHRPARRAQRRRGAERGRRPRRPAAGRPGGRGRRARPAGRRPDRALHPGRVVVVDLASVADTVVPDVDEAPTELPAVPVELPWPPVDEWVAACTASPMTSGPGAPLRQREARLWLARYDAQERQVVHELVQRTASLPDDLDLAGLSAGLDRLFPREEDADQRLAAAVCALSRVSVLAGGPGTGKTTTVSRVLALLTEQHPTWRVALAAPTGKAAARLEEAVRSSAAGFASAEDRRRVESLSGVTLHRLLGWRPGSRSRFRHDATNRLPVEVVVVDEASMVPLTMMARLLEALREGTRLVLVGDPDQLASVEAGAVLGDLVDRTSLGARTPEMAARLHRLAPDHAARSSRRRRPPGSATGSSPSPSTTASRRARRSAGSRTPSGRGTRTAPSSSCASAARASRTSRWATTNR